MLVSTFPLSPSGSAAGEAAQDGHPARYHGLNLGVEEYESLVARLMDTTVEAICGLEKSGRCIFVNRACVQLLGYEHPRQLIGKNFHELVHNRHEDGRPYPLEACRMRQRASAGEVAHVDDEVLWRRDGTCFPVEYWSYPILRDGRLAFILVTFLDISERRAQQRALAYQATRDSLTGLLNRGEFLRRLGERAHACATAPWTLVISNLDGFKEVNEALGHDAGDRVLALFADVLRARVRAGDLCARIGGEEFVVLAPNLGPLSALDLADRIRRGLAERASRTTGRLSVSIGIACASVDGHDLDRLLACADRALYEAKASGRDCVRQSAGR
ncbi:MAG: GGDEF domain-containing protein, partial [Burkholderiales bacterium]|nr:GGDEF domain-containing protein [Burkholderiales bacterium]